MMVYNINAEGEQYSKKKMKLRNIIKTSKILLEKKNKNN